jgi:F-type H+-transporting ATPase subunit c
MRKFGALLVLALVATVLPSTAFAQEAAAHGGSNWGAALGAGLAFGLAALGCGMGQGLTAGNTTAGIARNPGAAGAMNVPFILGMALIESIALIGFVTAFLLIGNI